MRKYVEIQQAFDALYKFQKTDEDGDMGPEYPHEWHQYAGSNRDREGSVCILIYLLQCAKLTSKSYIHSVHSGLNSYRPSEFSID